MIDLTALENYFLQISTELKALKLSNGAKNFYTLDEHEIWSNTISNSKPTMLILETPEGNFVQDGDNNFDEMPIALMVLKKVTDVKNNTKKREVLAATKDIARSIVSRLRRDKRNDLELLMYMDLDNLRYNKAANFFGGYYGWRLQIDLVAHVDMSYKANEWE